jgi:uncharacterized protein (DUF2336 family)
MTSFLGRFLKQKSSDPISDVITYEESRKIANDPDPAIRKQLAARTDIRPEVLYYLAEDAAPEVRREIATNEQTPAHANVLLARDGDTNVRCDLALKISQLAPELSPDERDKVRAMTLDALDILVQDQLVQVRQVIAEALKDAHDAPHGIIQRLARDAELEVAGPILEFSPIFTDEDLLEIISTTAVSGAIRAISRRDGVSEDVCDAIVVSDDVDGVTALLGNASAQIREETLDRLVEGSRRTPDWQMPIVKRSFLPIGAVRKLSSFVTDAVLGALMRRDDLDAETVDMVGKAVRERMNGDGAENQPEPELPTRENDARTKVMMLHAEDALDQDAIDEELMGGNRTFVTEALAVLSGLPPAVVLRIVSARSAKAVTALSWKAGLSMRFAIKLQARFANVPMREVLQAKNGLEYPMSEQDMGWQIDLFSG